MELPIKGKDMELPIKGKDIIAICSDGETRYLFRCSCHNEYCTEWRCSTMGHALMVEVVSWEYEK